MDFAKCKKIAFVIIK